MFVILSKIQLKKQIRNTFRYGVRNTKTTNNKIKIYIIDSLRATPSLYENNTCVKRKTISITL